VPRTTTSSRPRPVLTLNLLPIQAGLFLLVLLLPVALGLPALGQESDQAATEAAADSTADPGLEAMQAVAFLAGDWHGEGWMRRGPGEPSRFTSAETVESRLDGRVLLVEGLHYAITGEGAAPGPVVHHALAVLSWDAEAGRYRFRSYLADGRSGDYGGHLEDGAFVWGMELPDGAHTRYVIRVDDGRWVERGEYSRDGETWNEFFHMELEQRDAAD